MLLGKVFRKVLVAITLLTVSANASAFHWICTWCFENGGAPQCQTHVFWQGSPFEIE